MNRRRRRFRRHRCTMSHRPAATDPSRRYRTSRSPCCTPERTALVRNDPVPSHALERPLQVRRRSGTDFESTSGWQRPKPSDFPPPTPLRPGPTRRGLLELPLNSARMVAYAKNAHKYGALYSMIAGGSVNTEPRLPPTTSQRTRPAVESRGRRPCLRRACVARRPFPPLPCRRSPACTAPS